MTAHRIANLDPPHLPNAACRPADTNPDAVRAMYDLFFGPSGERPRDAEARNQQAKAICEACPELHACRTYALANPRAIGDDFVAHDSRKSPTYIGQIIGGLTLRERIAIRAGNPLPPPRLRLLTEPDKFTKTGKPLEPIKHGTVGGMSAHYRRNDLPPCDDCKAAHKARKARYKQPAQTVVGGA